MGLFQNPAGFGTGFRKKLPLPDKLSPYGYTIFSGGKKRFQIISFGTPLNLKKVFFLNFFNFPLT
jgi:hypothetical protein